ncbi:hypothetical protein BC938DRAFT_476297 [Jimgerdemannia flammicorona]|uniref:Uncharacterized protein n=1 Tax=Jimgerdemannia flammicorona TaxID=994334 RepID=A0A433PIB3_9FUNG|nr:hypothetical protein BC938DRAFT_476297 [Jimgerdemannia flammicorona]
MNTYHLRSPGTPHHCRTSRLPTFPPRISGTMSGTAYYQPTNTSVHPRSRIPVVTPSPSQAPFSPLLVRHRPEQGPLSRLRHDHGHDPAEQTSRFAARFGLGGRGHELSVVVAYVPDHDTGKVLVAGVRDFDLK